MPHGKGREKHIADSDVQRCVRSPNLVKKVAVCEHNSLRFTGGSRRVDDRGQIFRLAFIDCFLEAVRFGGQMFLSQIDYFLKSQDNRALDLALFFLKFLVHNDQCFQTGKVLFNGEYFFQLCCVLDKGTDAVAVREYISNFIRHRVRASRNVCSSDTQYPQVGDEPLFSIFRYDADVVTLFNTDALETGAEILRQGVEVFPTDIFIVSVTVLDHQYDSIRILF